MTITSVNNPYIKELLKLKTKSVRDTTKKFLVEGYHLVREAYNAQILETILIVDQKDAISGINSIIVTKQIIEKLAFTINPQNIIGVCVRKEYTSIIGTKLLVLDNLQDPGNVGTLIRSALGFNIDMVILCGDCVDCYNDKVIRATQGAIFKVPILKTNINEAIKAMKDANIKVYGTSLVNATPLTQIVPTSSYAIILGNEGNGLSKEVLSSTDENIYIEISNQLESLNVAIAGAIISHYFMTK